MTTVLDLAERHGMSPTAVKGWLRQRGLIGKKGDRVSSAAEEQFRKAHGGSVMLEVAFAEAERAPEPAPAPAARRARRPARTVGLVGEQQNERYYKKRYDDLHEAYVEARDAAQAMAKERDRACDKLAAAREKLDAARSRPGRAVAASLVQTLSARGVTDTAAQVDAVLGLLADPERAGALLQALRLADDGALDDLHHVCADPLCQKIATAHGWVALQSPPHGCSACAGRPTQRAYRWMAHRLSVARRLRLTVVGGSEQTHAELKALATLAPDLKQRLVDGTVKTTRQQARSHCRGSDVVVIWGSTRLDHAVSQLYKDEALAADHVLLVPVKAGARGVQTLARAVAEALG